MDEKIKALKVADLDNFISYVKKDSHFDLFMNLNNYLKSVLDTSGISDKIWENFKKEIEDANVE